MGVGFETMKKALMLIGGIALGVFIGGYSLTWWHDRTQLERQLDEEINAQNIQVCTEGKGKVPPPGEDPKIAEFGPCMKIFRQAQKKMWSNLPREERVGAKQKFVKNLQDFDEEFKKDLEGR